MKRETGHYWVIMIKGQTIGFFDGKFWKIIGSHLRYEDNDFLEILPDKIEMP
jgi:hypothetical protein